MKKRSKRNRPRPHRKWLLYPLLGLFLVVLLLCLVYGFWASAFDITKVREMRERSTVYDMDARVYSRLQGENRIVVPRGGVSENFVQALLVREDSRFYYHHGIDPIGVARAIIRNFRRGSLQQGASTLTQQLARNSFPLGGKTLHRKILEAFVAMRIEQAYTKEEILEHYMNRIYFGTGVHGIEAASQAYFGKPAKDLSVGEAAMIAGIIRGPHRYSPFNNWAGAIAQRDQVLERMVKLKKLSKAQSTAARETPIKLTKRRPLAAQENYAMDTVRRELDLLLTDELRDDGGLKIYTTIDPAVQAAAQTALDTELRKVEARKGYPHPKRADFSQQAREDEEPTPYLQGAVVVVDNRSGSLRAIVGGRDYRESKWNRAILTQAKRQVGSTFKPFVYAAAFEQGMLPGAGIDDGPIGRGEIRAASNWTPANSDGTHRGVLRAEEGLILSRNTMSVRVGERAGLPAIGRLAEAVGLPDLPQNPGVYLGTFETTVLDLTAAYTVFANGGTRRQTCLIERIDDSEGNVIYRAAHVARPALDPGVAWLTTQTLSKAMERGTGKSVKARGFSKPCAGKTGTTNNYVDAWFVGYTTALTCGVWVGLD
nr:PBP1A family penicillin-binding protein [Verrucomicrobiota bacterium]